MVMGSLAYGIRQLLRQRCLMHIWYLCHGHGQMPRKDIWPSSVSSKRPTWSAFTL